MCHKNLQYRVRENILLVFLHFLNRKKTKQINVTFVGQMEGLVDGFTVGKKVGFLLGTFVGNCDGRKVGILVGISVG